MGSFIVLDAETIPHMSALVRETLVARAVAKVKPEKPKAANPKPETLARIAREFEEKKTAAADSILEKAALSPLTGRLVSIGLGRYHKESGEWITAAKLAKTPADERELLTWAMEAIAKHPDPVLVTYNGRLFDCPFIVGRLMTLGMTSPYPLPLGYDRRRHCDLYELLGKNGQLGDWAMAVLRDTKTESGGKVVADMVANEEWDRLTEYQRHDVTLTCGLLARLLTVATL